MTMCSIQSHITNKQSGNMYRTSKWCITAMDSAFMQIEPHIM